MPQHIKIENATETKDKDIDLNIELDLLAERYLDLWQDNLRQWATDPRAFEKWLAEVASPITPSSKKKY